MDDTHTPKNRVSWRRFFALAIAAALLALATIKSSAAIAFDAAASTSASAATSVSWSHTVGSGTNTVLIVGLSTEDTSTSVLAVSSITYNGVAMTAISGATATAGSSTLDRSQLFYLLNPAAGAHTVAVTFGGSVNGVSAGSISLTGVAQNAPATAAINTATTGTTLSEATTVTTAGSWVVDAFCSGAGNATCTPGSSQTSRWALGESSNGGGGSTQSIAAAGTATSSWTASSSSQLALALAVLAPASGSSGTAPSITTQPTSQTVATGGTATFSVVASGTAPLTYQWKLAGTAISGATSSSLTISNAQSANAGSYTVTVTNSVGSVTSSAATLTVTSTVIAPTITTQPVSQTVASGSSVTFSVVASGTAPLSYQWKLGGTAISGATSSSFTIASATAANAGGYTVTVTNSAGSVTSSAATLTVTTTVIAPTITTQPSSQTVATGGSATFSVVASGTAPLTYQWKFAGTAISGATSSSYTIASVASSNAGSYTVTVTNSAGSVTSTAAVLTIGTTGSNAQYDLTGFATTGTGCTGGGTPAVGDPSYAQVTTPMELATAVLSFNKGNGIKVIEIMNDLNLGWNEIGSAVQTLASTPFSAAATPQLHPALIISGVSKMDIKGSAGGLTIFSANGSVIKHCTFNIKSTTNIIVRNLKFDEMFEWDEQTKGQYDKNDWDFIDIGNGGTTTNVWIDHCTFTKAYDGVVDTKGGSYNITFSWNKYVGDDGATNPNSFVWQQINALEANKSAYPMYNFLRTNGYSVQDIVTIMQGHDKTHLLGQNDLDSSNDVVTMTIHHSWAINLWDRNMPRLRAGQVHNYNNYVDDTGVLAAKRLRDSVAATMSTANQNTLNNTYSFDPPINGSISTEGGALLVEKDVYIDCLFPLRNNQTDVTNPEYTGKILATDTIYHMDNADGTTTDVRGNSTDAGSPLGPFEAPIIAFSWNTFTSLPYAYTLDDPTTLQAKVTAGAGAGVLTWDKSNWLKVSY